MLRILFSKRVNLVYFWWWHRATIVVLISRLFGVKVVGTGAVHMFDESGAPDFYKKNYAAIILAVAHNSFKSIDFSQLHNESTVVFDAKYFIDPKYIDGRL